MDQSIAAVPAIGESGVDTLRRVKGKLRGVETMLSLRHRVSMARDAAAISAATEEDFDPSWIDHVALSSLAVGYILYPSFTKTWLSFFSCKSVQTGSSSSSKYLTVDLRVECWSEKHQSMLQQVAYPATIIVVGFPLLVAALLWRNRAQLGSERMLYRMGFLYSAYRQKWFLWPLLVKARKILLAIAIELISDDDAHQVSKRRAGRGSEKFFLGGLSGRQRILVHFVCYCCTCCT